MPSSPNKLSQFWQELKRRRVLPFVIGYVAACIAIISFLLDSSEIFSVPEDTIRLLYLLSACGIPIVILLPWSINRKKTVIQPDESGDGELNTKSDKPHIQDKSIIVLPFENISPDPDQEYFSDGLTEEVIADLSYIDNLLVISRSSAMTFKGKRSTVREIADKVNVRYVLEGSVRRAGNNLRITAQLIDANNDAHLWAEKYNGTLDDVFNIQEKVSRSIAESLKMELTNEEIERISQRPIDNPQAYEYYLKAIQGIDSWTETGLEQALNYIQKGLEISGDNVLLYFGLGYIYFMYTVLLLKDTDECLIEAEQYANRIFDLDSDSVYGHRLLGLISARRSNLQQAVIQLKKYLAFNPNDHDVLIWLGIIYGNTGKQHALLPIAERLTQIDPFHPWGSMYYAWFYFLNGQFSESLEKGQQGYKLAPELPNMKQVFSQILAFNNQLEEAYALCDDLFKKYPTNIFAQVQQCYKFALQGNKEKALQAMSGGVKEKARYNNPYNAWVMAECDALIGEKDEAITSLEYAVNLGAVNYPWYNETDPFLENIRGEERFKKLMERVKHEWENFEV
jgi:non-specific serine/threonine protein kinase